jgi:hypothetical protein
MKYYKMLAMAILTMLSVAVLGQDSTMQKSKDKIQKDEKAKYSCSMHPLQVTKLGNVQNAIWTLPVLRKKK